MHSLKATLCWAALPSDVPSGHSRGSRLRAIIFGLATLGLSGLLALILGTYVGGTFALLVVSPFVGFGLFVVDRAAWTSGKPSHAERDDAHNASESWPPEW